MSSVLSCHTCSLSSWNLNIVPCVVGLRLLSFRGCVERMWEPNLVFVVFLSQFHKTHVCALGSHLSFESGVTGYRPSFCFLSPSLVFFVFAFVCFYKTQCRRRRLLKLVLPNKLWFLV